MLPFGLANGTATFQRLMETIFTGSQWKELILYVNDIITYSVSFDEGIKRLRMVFQKLKEAGLTLNLRSVFCFREGAVLQERISTDPEKISAIKE